MSWANREEYTLFCTGCGEEMTEWTVRDDAHFCHKCQKKHAQTMLTIYWQLKPSEQAGIKKHAIGKSRKDED